MALLSINITTSGDGKFFRISMRSPVKEIFDAAVVRLKHTIPPDQRQWQAAHKEWEIHTPAYALIAKWAVELPYDKEINEGRGLSYIPVAERSPYAELWLMEGAPREVVQAAYRALAKQCHPDVGGSKEMMQRINAAYEAITKS